MNLLILLFFPLLPSLISALPSPTLPQRDNDVNHPTPIRPFTGAAFQSPCPVNSNASFCSAGITGLTLRAQGGSFWLTNEPQRPNTACSLTSSGSTEETKNCPPGNQTVLWVDKDGQARLVRPHLLVSSPSRSLNISCDTEVLLLGRIPRTRSRYTWILKPAFSPTSRPSLCPRRIRSRLVRW